MNCHQLKPGKFNNKGLSKGNFPGRMYYLFPPWCPDERKQASPILYTCTYKIMPFLFENTTLLPTTKKV